MEFALLGFFTGLSLILAIGAQNIFVIEQGLKKQHVFLVCLICSLSDLILIFLGIFLFHYFNQYFNSLIELILNLFLILFLIHFIYKKIKSHYLDIYFSTKPNYISKLNVIFKTLGFTYLNPHVYSDTVFFLGSLYCDECIGEHELQYSSMSCRGYDLYALSNGARIGSDLQQVGRSEAADELP